MSFTESMTSWKGPGAIGLILAMTVLAGFILLGKMTLDDPSSGGGSIKHRVHQQERDLSNFQSELEMQTQRLASMEPKRKASEALDGAKKKLLDYQKTTADGRILATQLREEINQLELEHGQYVQQYRDLIRSKAKGTTLDHLQTLDGKVYQQVTIKEINAVGAQISHRDGVKRIPYQDLPKEMQRTYQFDQEEMEALARTEAMKRDANARAHQRQLDAMAAEKEQQRIENEKAAAKRAADAIPVIESKIQALEAEIRNLDNAIDLEKYKTVSRAPLMREELEQKKRDLNSLQSKLYKLQNAR